VPPIPVIPELARCLFCGPDNRAGLRLRFHAQGDGVTTTFTPSRRHQGYRGLMSGGLLAGIFDCLHYRVSVLLGVTAAVTARLEVDYRAPIPLDGPLAFEARLLSRRGRVVESRAVARLADGTVAAESRAVYVEVPAERLRNRGGSVHRPL
jgi:acyl-coenzyme A thioesterase PaaI-like protein